jgi:imidazolonepropionase-like amidohydrolase
VRRFLLRGGLPVSRAKDARYRDSFRALTRLVGALYRAGVRLVAGTVSFPGFAFQRELELYVEAGIPAAAVLQMATLGAAPVMKRDAELGSVTPGKRVVLVDGDPVARISDVRRTATVIRGGVIHEAATRYRAVGVLPP